MSVAESLLVPFQGQRIECTLISTLDEQQQLTKLCERLNIQIRIHRYGNPEIFEHEVMRILSLNAKRNINDYTMYFHTKGVKNVSKRRRRWREYLIENFLSDWEDIFTRLRSSDKDACGLWYGFEERDPKLGQIYSRFFAGNFWMARNSYIAKLPEYQSLLNDYPSRFLAERYIGWAEPKVMFLNQDDILPISGKDSVEASITRACNSKAWYQKLRSVIKR